MMCEKTAFNRYCEENGINANGQLAVEDLAPAFHAGYVAQQEQLLRRVTELEAERNAALSESKRFMVEAFDASEQITTMKSALRYLVEAILTRADADYMKRQMDEAVRVLGLHGISPPVPYKAIATITAALGEPAPEFKLPERPKLAELKQRAVTLAELQSAFVHLVEQYNEQGAAMNAAINRKQDREWRATL